MERYSGMLVFLLGCACIFAIPFCGECAPQRDASVWTCRNNLKQIGGSLLTYEVRGDLAWVPGSEFVLQVGRDLTPEQFRAFRCPGDPTPDERHRCSYRGADEWLLELRRSKGEGYRDYPYAACDANGPAGDEPFHEDGVCALTFSGSVEFVRWEDMKGYSAGPVPVGPGSPDPRFRHLIR